MCKKITKLLCFILIPTIIVCQENKVRTIESIIGGSFYRSINESNQIDYNEIKLFSPSIEIKLGREVRENLMIQLGLRYSKISFDYSSENLMAFEEIYITETNEEKVKQVRAYYFENSFGKVKIDSEVDFYRQSDVNDPKESDIHKIYLQSRNSIDQISVPIVLRKLIGKNRLKLAMVGGLTGNYVIGRNVNLEKYRQSGLYIDDGRISDERKRTTETIKVEGKILNKNLQNIVLDLNCGIGIEHLNYRNTFLIEVLYIRNLTSRSVKLNNKKEYLEALVMKIGFRYRLN